MSPISMKMMKEVVDQYGLSSGTVVDVGSGDKNGSYRSLFNGKYIGVDISPGPNVDILMGSEEWNELNGVDAVISGSTLEHILEVNVPGLILEMFRVLKPGGILCIIAPSAGRPHYYPIWVRNYSEEALREKVEQGGFKVLSCKKDPRSILWKFVCCVAEKEG